MPSQATHVADVNLLDVARTAARAAAQVVRERAADLPSLEWTAKSPTDFVSAVDLAAEERIRDVVGRLLPGAVVAGEELTPDAVSGEGVVFVADPLDGTTNFLHGLPHHCISIALRREAEVVAAVNLDPTHDRLFTATRGGGAFL
ncbi:MAG TPA: inositol monophosphatase family protein, partial [Gemmatimonadaceae bacterium]|nr:inositol monophosphatase family protein [Gemmatimonadaceae bacterium]